MLTNVSYVAAIPKEEIQQSGQLVGALFFKKVFGEHWAAKILPLMVVISCSGNIVSHRSLIDKFRFFFADLWDCDCIDCGGKYLDV